MASSFSYDQCSQHIVSEVVASVSMECPSIFCKQEQRSGFAWRGSSVSNASYVIDEVHYKYDKIEI